MWRLASGLGVLVACGGGLTVEPVTTYQVGADAERFAAAASAHDEPALRAMLADRVTNGGLWFDEPTCRTQFGGGGEVSGPALGALASCLASLGLRASTRDDALQDVAVLEYAPGLEVEARFTPTAHGHALSWIGYASRIDGDVLPSATASALETLRTAGAPDGPIDPAGIDPAVKARSWLKVCLDANGTVIRAQVRETTSTAAARLFTAAAAAWRFQPFVLGGKPAPVCGMFAMHVPGGRPDGDRESLPLPVTMRHGAVLVPERELTRLAGEKQITPDDATKTAIQKAGSPRLIGSFKVCLDLEGKPTDITVLRPTGSQHYDLKIRHVIERTWRYAPVIIDGQPRAVCTAVTFIYSQR